MTSPPVPVTLNHKPGEFREPAEPQDTGAYNTDPTVVPSVVDGTDFDTAPIQPVSGTFGMLTGAAVGGFVIAVLESVNSNAKVAPEYPSVHRR